MPEKKTPGAHEQLPVPVELVERRIYLIRGHRVMLDADLAALYQVATKAFNQAVQRNKERFPADFMFRLTAEESSALRSQFVTLEKGRGRYPKYAPYAFTEHGVAMLSAILRSKRAVQMNIVIIRAFIKLREVLASNKDLAQRMEKLETSQKRHASVISLLAEEIDKLKRLPPAPPKRPIGFRP
jgi:ORF6N domain